MYVNYRLHFTFQSATIQLKGLNVLFERSQRPINLDEVAIAIAAKMGIESNKKSSATSLLDEIGHFLATGDFEEKSDKIVCVNPTLLTLDDKKWEVSGMTI